MCGGGNFKCWYSFLNQKSYCKIPLVWPKDSVFNDDSDVNFSKFDSRMLG
jgi:hypothetical protein